MTWQFAFATVCTPDALITHQFLSHGSGFVAAQALLGHTPAIVLCQRGEADYPAADGIYTMFLPVSASGLLKKIDEATEFGRELRVATHALKLTEQRDVIARAKQWLMQTQGMREPQAHAALQRISMDDRLKLFEAAQKVLTQRQKRTITIGECCRRGVCTVTPCRQFAYSGKRKYFDTA